MNRSNSIKVASGVNVLVKKSRLPSATAIFRQDRDRRTGIEARRLSVGRERAEPRKAAPAWGGLSLIRSRWVRQKKRFAISNESSPEAYGEL